MSQHLSPVVYEFSRAMYSTLGVLWGVVWAVVAYYYGKASYASWLAADGKWRYVVRDLTAPAMWGVRYLFSRLRLVSKPRFPGHYEPGHVLRFSIFLGTISPIFFGFFFMFNARLDWTAGMFLGACGTIVLSILAGVGHLFLAYRERPLAWAMLVLASLTWLCLGPAFFHLVLFPLFG